jgi:hypothetical protein
MFCALVKQPCAYCGTLHALGRLSGIDRVVSTMDYSAGNIVPSCDRCNSMKGSTSFRDFALAFAPGTEPRCALIFFEHNRAIGLDSRRAQAHSACKASQFSRAGTRSDARPSRSLRGALLVYRAQLHQAPCLSCEELRHC